MAELEKIFPSDRVRGGRAIGQQAAGQTPRLQASLAVEPGDMVIACKLDRLQWFTDSSVTASSFDSFGERVLGEVERVVHNGADSYERCLEMHKYTAT